MKYAPLLMMFFGYWCMGNMQIFNYVINPLTYTNKPLVTGHKVYPTVSQSLPLFITGCAVAFAIIFTDIFQSCLVKMKIMTLEDVEEEVDERLGSYFECIPI